MNNDNSLKSTGSPSPDAIRSVYDGAAAEYDRTRLKTPYQLRFDASERRILSRYLSGFDNVLEVGAGTGRLTGEILKRSPYVTVVDISPGMLEHLRKKFSQHPGLETQVWDVYELEKLSGYGNFDAVLSMRMLPHIEDIPAVLRKLRGAVRPGGTIMVDFWNRNSYVYKKKRGSAVYNNYVSYAEAMEMISGADLELIAIEGAGFGCRFDLDLEFLGRTPLKRFAYSLIATCRRPAKKMNSQARLTRAVVEEKSPIDFSLSDLERIICQSKLDTESAFAYKSTAHRFTYFRGRRLKVRVCKDEEIANRKMSLHDRVPHLFAKCYGRLGRFIVWEFVEGMANDYSKETLAAIGHFLADLAATDLPVKESQDFDAWCEELLNARIFTARTIALARVNYATAVQSVERWQLEYFDAMPWNFVNEGKRVLCIDGKHLRVGPEGISLVKPYTKLKPDEFLTLSKAYRLDSGFERFGEPEYRKFLHLYYLVYGLAEVGARKGAKRNRGINDFHKRRRQLLQIVKASRLLRIREESFWVLRHRLHHIWGFIRRPIAYLKRRSRNDV